MVDGGQLKDVVFQDCILEWDGEDLDIVVNWRWRTLGGGGGITSYRNQLYLSKSTWAKILKDDLKLPYFTSDNYLVFGTFII